MSVLIAVVVGVALSISGLTPRNVTKQTKPEQSSEAEGGIKLLVSVSKEHFQVGEPILLKLVLKNDTSQELRLVSTGIKDYKLDVKNEQGKLMPLTAAGEALKRTEVISVSKGRITLEPAEERDQGEIPLTDRFKLTEPGKYVIVVRRPGLLTDGKLSTIESNKVTVMIE
ncbi:MAG: hypothetical protein ACJ8LM_15480 [Candidatus Udaeobacter sp.]